MDAYTRQFGASSEGRFPESVAAGNTPRIGKGRAVALAELPVIRVSCRSSFCARIADSTERAGQEINFQRLLAYFCMQVFQIRSGGLSLGNTRKNARGVLQQLSLPLRDLIRMNVKLLC